MDCGGSVIHRSTWTITRTMMLLMHKDENGIPHLFVFGLLCAYLRTPTFRDDRPSVEPGGDIRRARDAVHHLFNQRRCCFCVGNVGLGSSV